MKIFFTLLFDTHEKCPSDTKLVLLFLVAMKSFSVIEKLLMENWLNTKYFVITICCMPNHVAEWNLFDVVNRPFPNFNDVSDSQIGNGAKRDKHLACDQRKVNTNTFQIKYFSNEFQIYWYLFLFLKDFQNGII